MIKSTKLILVILAVFCLPLNVYAKLPQAVKNDFSPLSGIIIMPIGNEYLVDLDASRGLKEGDILALTFEGENIIHPVTKEVLGSLDEVHGFMQVTQIKSGYSYAKIITAQNKPQKGDKVKRFEQVPALIDSTIAGTPLAEELKTGLPQFKWLTVKSPEIPLITFQLKDNQLQAINNAGIQLKSYPYINGSLSAPAGLTHVQNGFVFGVETGKKKSLLNQTVDNLLGTVGFDKKDKRLENPAITRSLQQNNSDIWFGPNLNGNPVGVAIDDFDQDGQNEIAIAMGDQLNIYRLSDNHLQQVGRVEFKNGVHLLSLDTADLDKNGIPELYATANVGKTLSSQVVMYHAGTYQRIENQISWFLRKVQVANEKILLGQAIGSAEDPLSGSYFLLQQQKGKLTRAQNFPLPADLNIFSLISINKDGNNTLYATISSDDHLSVKTQSGNQLWQSTDYYGGTEESFYLSEDTQVEMAPPIYIQQRLLSLPDGNILVPQNEGSRLLKNYHNFSKSRIIAMKWDGFALQEIWQTPEQSGYLVDFALADADNDGNDELVTVVKYSENNLLQKGRSTVVIYELNK